MIRLEMTNIRQNVRVTPILESIVEHILRWFEHVHRKHIDYVVKRADHMTSSQTFIDRRRLRKTIR